MNVLFNFHVSFSGRDMSRNVWNRPSGSFMVAMGISSNIMKSPCIKCYMTFWDMIIYSDTLHWWGISLNRDLVTELDLITVFDVITLIQKVSIRHLQRVWLANRRCFLLRTPGPVPFGTCISSNVETIHIWTCYVYGPLSFEHPTVLLFFLWSTVLWIFFWYRGLWHRTWCEVNFVWSGSKIVKRLRRRKYDTVIIERTIDLVLGLSTVLYRSFLKHCTLTNKSLDLRSLQDGRTIAYSGRCLYIYFYILFYHLTCLCNNFYGLSALVGCWSSVFIRRIIYKFLNACPFDYIAFAVSGKVGIP